MASLIRYAELLEGHAALALAVGSVEPKLLLERIVLPGLRGEGSAGSKRWGQHTVLALGTLRRLLHRQPDALGAHAAEVTDDCLKLPHIASDCL